MPDMASAPRLSPESREIALEMLRTPVAQLSKKDWDQGTAADLRRFLVRQIEAHIERRLVTAPLFESSKELWPRMNTDEHG
jgi:DNA repair protein RecO (recombination protein O)